MTPTKPTTPTLRRTALATLLAAAAVIVAACGGSKHNSTTSIHTTATTTPAPPSSGTTTGATTTSTTSAATPVQTAIWTLPDRQAQRMQVSIYDLRRDGPYLVLDFGLRCLTAGGCDTYEMLSQDSHEMTSLSEYEAQNYSASGVVLVDPAAAQAYRVATNHDGDAFTSALQGYSLPTGQTHLEFARYRLPPASVHELDVGFPSAGPIFSAVPITTGTQPPDVPGAVPAVSQTDASFSTTSTTGMTLPVRRLTLTSGSDSRYTTDTATRSSIALRGDVLFHFDKSSLTIRARSSLRAVSAQIKARATGTIQVTGYTDDIGTRAFNLGLSRRRAASVVGALRRLTPGVRYTSTGRGEADPVANNKTPSGRALNRRVTVAFAVKRQPPAQQSTASGPTSTQTSGAVRFTATTGHHYRLSIASARRDGQLLLVQIDVACLTHPNCSPGGDLGAGTYTIPPEPAWQRVGKGYGDFAFAGIPSFDSINGFTLLDPATGEAYLAAGTGFVPLTGTFNVNTHPAAGKTTRIWAYYPAPPASTTRLQLLAPEASGYFHTSTAGRPQVQLGAG